MSLTGMGGMGGMGGGNVDTAIEEIVGGPEECGTWQHEKIVCSWDLNLRIFHFLNNNNYISKFYHIQSASFAL
jgi:hypothetical protein